MIKSVRAYTDSAGNTHPTLDAAQTAEVQILLDQNQNASDVAGHIVKNKDKVVDILTTTENSRPSARKVNGGRKPRKAKEPVLPLDGPTMAAAAVGIEPSRPQ